MVALAHGGGPISNGNDATPGSNHPQQSNPGSSLNYGPWGSRSFQQAGGGGAASHYPFPGMEHPPASGDADSILDVIPAPLPLKQAVATPSGFPGDMGGSAAYSGEGDADEAAASPSSAASMLANIHMRLLDFLAWDRTRGLRCGRDGKQEAYWRSLLPAINSGAATSGAGGSGGSGSAGNGEASASQAPLSFDDDEFGGVPETTLPGLRDSRELVQASPHGFPELVRLVAIHREGVLRKVETRRTAMARGFTGLRFGRKGDGDAKTLRARVLDPLGEAARILRHVMRSEEARPFLEPASDADVDPDSERSSSAEEESGSGSGSSSGSSSGDGGGEGVTVGEGKGVKKEGEVKRPLDLGTILKRADSGWYDPESGSHVRL